MPEKTEAPTGRRLSEARAEGQVAKSAELNAAAALLVGTWLLTGPGRQLVADMQAMMVESVSALPRGEITSTWLRSLALTDGLRVIQDMGLILFGLALTGVVVTLGQTGFLWASKRLGPDFSRINPLNGFKRIFSTQGVFEFVKALLKLLVVGWVAYSFLNRQVDNLLSLGQMDFLSAVGFWSGLAGSLAMRVGGTYLILAAADYAYQRWTYMKNMRMSKEEVKEDMKRSEGDPFLKSRIRAQQRRMARQRMMSKVPKADVIITNPTHLAIAIQYRADEMRSPKVLAKGAHHVAERIVAIARQHTIPIVQNIPLARAIYKTVEIDQEIPPELYVAMAEVLAYVYKIRSKAPA